MRTREGKHIFSRAVSAEADKGVGIKSEHSYSYNVSKDVATPKDEKKCHIMK